MGVVAIVDVDLVVDSAVDVSATFVVGVDVGDNGGPHVHGAVDDHDHVDVKVNAN